MKFQRHILSILIMLGMLISASVVFSQEDEGSGSIYADILQSRGDDGSFILGDPEAPVKIIEFADFLCPHCQEYEEVTQQFIQDFVVTGKAQFEYRFMPIIDEFYSPLFASLNECAAEENLFWEAREVLFDMAINSEVGVDSGEIFTERLGLNFLEVSECVSFARQYRTDYNYGNDLGVSGTPAIRVSVVDGEAGVISIDGRAYSSGGVPLEVLTQFVESENPAELIQLVNQLRNERHLADISLISGEPCAAPCWQGITPGETTWADAVEIVENDEQLEIVERQEASQSPAKRIRWAAVDGDPCCEMVTLDGEIVAFVRVLTKPEMTLGDLIDHHGEPAYLIGSESTKNQALFTLFYPDIPMLVYVFVAGAEEGELSETSQLLGFQYLMAEDMDRLLEANQIYAWDGLKSFADYADDELITAAPESD